MKPNTWSLANISNEELLLIAEQRLRRNFRKSKWQLRFASYFKYNKHLANTFYADWYAAEALRFYRERTK